MTRHVELIHLSDMHFGEDHRFAPGLTPDGVPAAAGGYPTLADCLLSDLLNENNEPPRPTLSGPVLPASIYSESRDWNVPPMPKLLCLSGDFTVGATLEEFNQAADFIKKLCAAQPSGLGVDGSRIFVCPGNHDLDYEAKDPKLRWSEYASFLGEIYDARFKAADAERFGGVRVCDETGVIVLSLNSEMEVHNQPRNKTRGDLSQAQLHWAQRLLEAVPKSKRRDYIKVALVHHHPILLPTLAEAGRGYDAINGAQHLLMLLHRYGFHLLLHGHKHYPHTFHENVRNAFERNDEHALLVVAGGSCGSRGLPDKQGATQTYNRICIHWDAEQGTTRVQVVTRGLVRHDEDGTDLLAPEWHWQTLATDDRHLLLGRRARVPSPSAMRYLAPGPADSVEYAARAGEYGRTRGNFPVAEVRPSLLPGQTNEVLLRLVSHPSMSRLPGDDPVAVTWSAGYKFPKVHVTRDEDPEFCAVFAYYGGALMQASLEFADGYRCDLFIYAPMFAAVPEVAAANPPTA